MAQHTIERELVRYRDWNHWVRPGPLFDEVYLCHDQLCDVFPAVKTAKKIVMRLSTKPSSSVYAIKHTPVYQDMGWVSPIRCSDGVERHFTGALDEAHQEISPNGKPVYMRIWTIEEE